MENPELNWDITKAESDKILRKRIKQYRDFTNATPACHTRKHELSFYLGRNRPVSWASGFKENLQEIDSAVGYSDWVGDEVDAEGNAVDQEAIEANPDLLPDTARQPWSRDTESLVSLKMLKRLDDRQREIFNLWAMGHTDTAIAIVLRLSRGHVSRIKKQIKTVLKGYEG